MEEILYQLRYFVIDNLSGYSPRDIPNFFINIALAAVMAYLLGRLYVKYGNALSNRRAFARNFILLAVITMFIITVVKSSLALSLGLVGALSIVRFRAAIKEPEELVYLFLTIAIGLGCGAGFSVLTIFGFGFFALIIWMLGRRKSASGNQLLYITIKSMKSDEVNMNNVVEVLGKYCAAVKLKRLEEEAKNFEATFNIEVGDYTAFDQLKTALVEINPDIEINYLDTSRDF